MAKTPANNKRKWTPAQRQQLRKLAKGNTPTRVIALKMKRSPGAVQTQATRQGTSLKPTNQSPYGAGGRRRGRKDSRGAASLSGLPPNA